MFSQNRLSMQVILSAYGSTSARSYPVSLVYSGWYTWYDGKTNDQNDLGSYYPALSYTQDIAYYLVLSSDSLAPRDATSKKRGFALRRSNFLLALALLVVIRCLWCCQEYISGKQDKYCIRTKVLVTSLYYQKMIHLYIS